MNQQHNKASTPTPSRGPRRWLIAGALVLCVGAMAAAGASMAGDGLGMGLHGHRGHAQMDPASMARHVDQMVERVLADGTPAQKARLAAIAKSAYADLLPMHAELKAAHTRAHDLLTAPAIDRAALEQLRAEQMQHLDVVSKRILLAVEDAAEVLTPEQRLKFAEHMQKRMH
ncbi:MAG: periplasmic heavy metal sensor [Pseudomonadota bacterium]